VSRGSIGAPGIINGSIEERPAAVERNMNLIAGRGSMRAVLKTVLCLALSCTAALVETGASRTSPAAFATRPGAMAVLSFPAGDGCGESVDARVSAVGVWVDGRYEHELLLFPGSRRNRYDTLLGPFAAGRHQVELRPSAYWQPSPCVRLGPARVTVVDAGGAGYDVLRHAPVLELRADTVGEQTDAPLYEYVEDVTAGGVRRLWYTVVFSNEDGGTQTRALLARWGRTTDIEQVYETSLQGGLVIREEFQGPDHQTRPFAGRRRGVAPILLVATVNNMVTDRGRGIASARPVPDLVDLSGATRESTLDSRPWAYRVMGRELAAEGRISADAPAGDRWVRQAPDPREHVYLEARLTLDRAVVAAWASDGDGHRFWSHYEREALAIDRNGWVRSAVAIGPNPGSRLVELGWACLPAPGQPAQGSCVVEASRAFAFGDGWVPGPNLVVPTTLELRAGEEASLRRRND
jgi:hypothetical protein